MQLKSKFILALVCVAAAATLAPAQTSPTVIPATSAGNNGAGPNGIAATTAKGLLFTQPFCVTPQTQTRGIYQENLAAGTSTLLSPIPEEGPCAENYIAISTGLGGFTAGDTFTTGVSTTNTSNDEIFKNGSTPFVNGITTSKNHVGVTFDTAGTFGGDLIATSEDTVTGYNPAGTVQFTYLAPLNTDYILEGATVAPLTASFCPGCLYITGTLASNVNAIPKGQGAIFIVLPGQPSGTRMTQITLTPFPEPEGLVFIDNNNLSCTLPGANGAAFSYFVSGFDTGAQKYQTNFATNGAILAYTPAQLTPYVGKFLVPDETGPISAFNGLGTFTPFTADTGYQNEGSTAVTCAATGTGCPATFGFWKHHPFPSSMFVAGTTSIGCKTYTAAQLVDILNANNAGGNAVTILGHQLIAAIANYDAGARQTPAATAAIGAAIALLCANNIDMSTSFVQASSALGQQLTALADTLDAFNSGSLTPNCSEGSGLTLGALVTPKSTNAIALLVRPPALTKVVASEY